MFFFIFSVGMTSLPVQAVPIGTTYTTTLTDLGGGLELTGSVLSGMVTSTAIKTGEVQGQSLWDYIYHGEFTAPVDATQAWIQTSRSLTTANFIDVTPADWDVDSHNLGYAQDMHGILFRGLSCLICDISFTSTGEPVLGSISFDFGSPSDVAYNENFGGSIANLRLITSYGFALTPGDPAVFDPQPQPVSEPGSFALTTLALIGLAGASRRRKN